MLWRPFLRTAALAALRISAPLLAADDYGAVRQEFLAKINGNRAEQGVAALRLSDSLTAVAQRIADDAARRGDSEPETLDSSEIVRRAEKAGYSAKGIAQVLARADGTIDDVVLFLRDRAGSSWRTLVSGTLGDLGVGVAVVDDVPLYVFVLGISWEEYTARRAEAFRDLPAMRKEMLDRVNAERTRRGIPDIHSSAVLDRVAQSYAEDMLKRSYYGHESPEGDTVRERVIEGGYKMSAVGENVASGQPTIEEVMAGWMGSLEHRNNILSRIFVEVGFGVAVGKNRTGYQIIWVQVFGRPRFR